MRKNKFILVFYINHYKRSMKIVKKIIINNVPVEIKIEDNSTHNEKLLMLLDIIKSQLDSDYEEYILENNKAKLKEYNNMLCLIGNARKKLEEVSKLEQLGT